jgi:hypothetical protein
VLGLALPNHCNSRLLFCPALHDLRARGVDTDGSALELRFCFAALRLEHFGVHLDENLSCGHQVSLVNQDLFHTARRFGGYVDFSGLNAPIAAGDAGG